jgi:hypothetical protein
VSIRDSEGTYQWACGTIEVELNDSTVAGGGDARLEVGRPCAKVDTVINEIIACGDIVEVNSGVRGVV